MLGELIGEENGQIIGQRVLESTTGAPTMETSFRAEATLLGIDAINQGTYTATMRPDGTLVGGGQGIMMGKNGETMTWKAQGVGVVGKDGSVAYRGSLMYQTTSEKWLRLNRIAGVFEYNVTADGKNTGKTWEWK